MALLTQAWHSWKSARTVYVLAVLALAVGIGATTAIFSVIDAVMLRPLAYEHGERFAQLFSTTPGKPDSRGSLRLADLLVMRERAQSLDLFGWFKPQSFNLTSPGAPRHVDGTAVTTTLINQLGVPPLVGQWFQNERSAVISQRLWMQLGGQPDLVGSTVMLNGRPFTLVGVAPERFRLPEVTPGGEGTQNDVWIGLDPDGRDLQSGDGTLFSYVRLKPGVTFAQADAEIRAIAADLARGDPIGHDQFAALLDSLPALVGRSIRPTLLLLFGAAGFLLLITCANVAALFVARSVARSRDTAIHVALGASRGRLARQYFSEGLQVSLAGAALGVLLSVVLVRIVIAMASEFIPRAEAVRIDWRVWLFTLGVAVVASALSSLAPLWQASLIAPNAVLTDGARASAGRGARHVTRGLVIAELALAFMLLAVSGLLIAHLRAIGRTWPGFDPDRLLVFELTMPEAVASSREAIVARQQQLLDAIDRVPGVTGVALANQAPLDGCCLTVSLYPDDRPSAFVPPQKTAFLPITPSYFDTLRIPLKQGRRFTYGDVSDDVLTVMINEAAAAEYWPGRDAEGATGRFTREDGDPFRVVGVVGDIRSDGLNRSPVPEVYLLHSVVAVNPMKVFVRGDLPVDRLTADVRRAVASFDAAQPVYAMASYADVIGQSLAVERVGSFMTGFFAGAALLMAMLGTYGVIAYAVRLQRVEIGTRMALGADRRDVLAHVFGGGVRMTLWGLAAGALLAVGAVAVLTAQFRIRELGVLPFAAAAAIVAGLAAVATFFPAWRATLMSPLVALRDQAGSIWEDARASARETAAALSRAVGSDGTSPRADAALLTEFVDAARAATSNQEALTLAITALRETFDAEWAILLEPGDGPAYRQVASSSAAGTPLAPVPSTGFLTGRLRFHGSPITFASADLETSAAWAATHRPAQASEIGALATMRAAVAVPLRTQRELLGIVLLGRLRDDRRYGVQEKQVLRATADLVALMLENARLTGRVLEQEKLRRDLALAAEVQKRLLPERPPEARGLSLAAISVPARSVGGDYYDFVEIDDHRLAIAIADVSGKGVPAALIMSVVHASLRVISADAGIAPPDLAARMNSFLHRCTRSNSYATFFYAQFDDRTRQLTYVNAGHNPPYLVRAADGSLEELKAGGTVIGLFEEMTYESAATVLHPDDVLVVFTDGVPEAMNVADEEFGEARLQDLVRQLSSSPAAEIVARLADALRGWTAGATPHDDLTFVVMKVEDGPAAT